MNAEADLRPGSRWKHVKRKLVAIVLEVSATEVRFQFPSGLKNPVRGMGKWPIARFLERFVCDEASLPQI